MGYETNLQRDACECCGGEFDWSQRCHRYVCEVCENHLGLLKCRHCGWEMPDSARSPHFARNAWLLLVAVLIVLAVVLRSCSH